MPIVTAVVNRHSVQTRIIRVDVPQDIIDEGSSAVDDFIADSSEVRNTDFSGSDKEAEYEVEEYRC